MQTFLDQWLATKFITQQDIMPRKLFSFVKTTVDWVLRLLKVGVWVSFGTFINSVRVGTHKFKQNKYNYTLFQNLPLNH